VRAIDYLASLPFAADRFQLEAAEAIDRGESVVVAAPTGSGKTVVAEAAIAAALSAGKRAVYTTPIKALSNQKFSEFRARYGEDRMYAGSPDLADLGVVVLDEVHYLQDRARGAVWEEIIIHLDQAIPLVCLSATVPNADEFTAWVAGRRGPTALVVERERPVPLESTYLLKDRWESNRLQLFPIFERDLPAAPEAPSRPQAIRHAATIRDK